MSIWVNFKTSQFNCIIGIFRNSSPRSLFRRVQTNQQLLIRVGSPSVSYKIVNRKRKKRKKRKEIKEQKPHRSPRFWSPPTPLPPSSDQLPVALWSFAVIQVSSPLILSSWFWIWECSRLRLSIISFETTRLLERAQKILNHLSALWMRWDW